MRIAVAATGPTMDSMISPSCTETTHFVFMNLASGEYHIFEKPAYSTLQGKDMPIADSLLGSGIQAVLLEDCKPEVRRRLQTGGIRVYTHVSGTVSEAIEQYKEGRLSPDPGCFKQVTPY
jgi:predicted Fe-Mo cluster-binding NifX family protein